jgi:ribose/xylose/arabinose/galactoside ABC-type transport system permease subunit
VSAAGSRASRATPRTPGGSAARAVAGALVGRYTGVLFALVGLSVALALTQPTFLTWANWENIIRSGATVYVLGIGMTVVVLGAGIDLSVGSAVAAAGMVIGLGIEHGLPWELACAAGVAAGTAMGVVNGILVGVARIPFFVVTLGTLSIYQSLALLVADGGTINLFGYGRFMPVQQLIDGSVGPLPSVLVIGAAFYVAGAIVLRATSLGRAVYACGSNAQAARLAGIRVPLVIVGVYAVSGMFAGFGAIVATGQLTAAAPTADPNLVLTVIAAVLIGGTQFSGGEGGLLGTVIGVTFLEVVQNGLELSSIPTFWQGMASGAILIIAVGLGVSRGHVHTIRRRLRRDDRPHRAEAPRPS